MDPKLKNHSKPCNVGPHLRTATTLINWQSRTCPLFSLSLLCLRANQPTVCSNQTRPNSMHSLVILFTVRVTILSSILTCKYPIFTKSIYIFRFRFFNNLYCTIQWQGEWKSGSDVH